jgi:hypothetical protein
MSDAAKPICGLVMPISAIDGCTEAHWLEVRGIHEDAIRGAGFEPKLVSEADEVGIIQKRIVQNLYDNPIAVVDVSGKNPNVMFELGMRLAFDKPTIIVKDDKTTYSFDTAPIEHLPYPRDLRFQQIVDFKEKLAGKIAGTHKSAREPSYTTFLKHFGEFTVAKIDKKEVSAEQAIIEELREDVKSIRALLQRDQIQRSIGWSNVGDLPIADAYPMNVFYGIQISDSVPDAMLSDIVKSVSSKWPKSEVWVAVEPPNRREIRIKAGGTLEKIQIMNMLRSMLAAGSTSM